MSYVCYDSCIRESELDPVMLAKFDKSGRAERNKKKDYDVPTLGLKEGSWSNARRTTKRKTTAKDTDTSSNDKKKVKGHTSSNEKKKVKGLTHAEKESRDSKLVDVLRTDPMVSASRVAPKYHSTALAMLARSTRSGKLTLQAWESMAEAQRVNMLEDRIEVLTAQYIACGVGFVAHDSAGFFSGRDAPPRPPYTRACIVLSATLFTSLIPIAR